MGYICKNISSNGDINQLDKIALDLINKPKCIDYIKYFKTNIDINYNDIINIWNNFLKKKIFNICNQDSYIESSLKISLLSNNLTYDLERLLNCHIDCFGEDLLLFYIKNTDNILLLYKSYIPLQKSDKVRLPYFDYLIEDKRIKNKFNDILNDSNICIIGYSKI